MPSFPQQIYRIREQINNVHIRRGGVLDASAVLHMGRHHCRHRRAPAGSGLCDAPPLLPLQETDTDYSQQQVFNIDYQNSNHIDQIKKQVRT